MTVLLVDIADVVDVDESAVGVGADHVDCVELATDVFFVVGSWVARSWATDKEHRRNKKTDSVAFLLILGDHSSDRRNDCRCPAL